MESLKTIIVTGCNKGIGYAIIENLFQKSYRIIMACRNPELANQAKQNLELQFPNSKSELIVKKLDVSNNQSIKDFSNEIKKEFSSIDILLNNAGMAYKGDLFNEEVVKTTLTTNYFGAVDLSNSILDLIKENGKIIHVASMVGKYRILKSDDLKKRFQDQNIDELTLNQLAEEYISSVKNNTFESKGWPKWGYGVSKLLLNVYIRILSQNPLIIKKNIQVYSCCPGYVKTDMSSFKGVLTIQEGAITPIYLVELPFEVNKEFQGQFFQEKKVSSLE